MAKRVISNFSLLIAVALLMIAANLASAAAAQIVAFGASNTAGYGVESGQAWPVRLEEMLRAKGYQATVANAGISGDTTVGMLERLDAAVPDGTELVILAIFPYNDAGKGISAAEHEANIQKIQSRLGARGIRIISAIPYVAGLPLQSDNVHLTAESHAALATRLLPHVIAAVARH